MNKKMRFAFKQKINKGMLLTAVFLLFTMSSCMMPELAPELYVGTLNIENAGEVNINNPDNVNINPGGNTPEIPGIPTTPGVNDGYLVIKNSTPGQTIHFIRIKYPNGAYKIISTDIPTGEDQAIILPKGDYEVSISEDGIYYSSTEPAAIEPVSSPSDGKILDTATHFLPPGWWSTGGCNTTDPTQPEYNPQGPGGGGGPGPGGDYPIGYLAITNNYNSPIDTIEVTYVRKPDGSTSGLPAINPIPGASNPQTLTLNLDPPLKTGETIEIPLPIGWYRIRVGYQGANSFPIWFGNPSEIEREIKEGESTSVELGADGVWDNPNDPTDPTDPTNPVTPIDPGNGNGYIKIKNIYQDSIINVIDVYSTDTPATLAPNPTGPVSITPLFYNDVYYYSVPQGSYKVRVGFQDDNGNINWYTPKDYTGGNWWDYPTTNVVVTPGQDLNEIPPVPEVNDGQGPGSNDSGYYNPANHTKGYVAVRNSSTSIIRGFTVTDVSSDMPPAGNESWGAATLTAPGVANGSHTLEVPVTPGKKYINIWLTRKDTPNKLTLVHKESFVYIDTLTVFNLISTMTIETYPEHTTPTSLLGESGTIIVVNGQKTGYNLTDIVVVNYGKGTVHSISSTLKGSEKDPGNPGEIRASGTNLGLIPGQSSPVYSLPPGMYRLAVKKSGHTTWYGKNASTWKLVHVRSGVPLVFSFDGTHLDP
jgi:hypothetical protein